MIGTAAALLGSAALGVAGSAISGAVGSKAAKQAASAQETASLGSQYLQQQGIDFAKQQYADSRADSIEWMKTGRDALSWYSRELGLAPGGSQFKEQPGYQFQVSEGEKGVVNNLSALGMKNSGSALKALTRFRTGLADQSYNTYVERLGNLAGVGQTAAQNVGSLGASATNAVQQGLQGMGQAAQDAGTARASGYTGSANAYQSALGGGINSVTNALGRYSYGNSRGTNIFPAAGGLY